MNSQEQNAEQKPLDVTGEADAHARERECAQAARSDRKNARRAFQYGGAVVFWLALWVVIALAVSNPILLAGPGETLLAFVENLVMPSFWDAVAQTTVRIVGVGVVSACAGTLLGLAAARWNGARVLFAPIMQVMKSAPVACIIVIVLVAAGAVGALVSIVAFVTIPPFYIAALEAQQARKPQTERVLRLGGVSPWRAFLSSTWPAMLPFFSAAAKTAIGLSWKAGITAELLCIPLGSIGAAIYGAKLTLDTPALLMWTIVVMIMGWLSEKIVVALIEATKASPRWAVKGALKEDGARSELAHGALALEDVRFGYVDEQLVLDDVSLRVLPGERLCLMAATGTGKTTLISLLLESFTPSSGITSRPERLGLVLQETTLIESLSALQNVQLVCGSSVPAQELERELSALLPEGTLHTKASDLSGGTRRLTEIARALFSPTDAVILDEPFTGLDENANARACAFILDHLSGRPLLFTTHHPEDAERLNSPIATL